MAPVSESSQTIRRVGLNAHLLSLTATYRGAGINGYIYQLLRHLPAADASLHYVAYLYDPGFAPVAGLEMQRSRWDTRSPWRRILWEQTSLAGQTRETGLTAWVCLCCTSGGWLFYRCHRARSEFSEVS